MYNWLQFKMSVSERVLHEPIALLEGLRVPKVYVRPFVPVVKVRLIYTNLCITLTVIIVVRACVGGESVQPVHPHYEESFIIDLLTHLIDWFL